MLLLPGSMGAGFPLRKKTANERTINTFGQYCLYGAGVATPDPGEAPPLAGFNMKSPAASNHTTP
jgi:hypothetical protein